MQIIEELSYVDVQETFAVLCELYLSAASGEERRRIIQAAERLSHNDLEVWRQVGFTVQKLLQALKDDDRAKAQPLVLAVARQILNPELSGSTWNFDSVSIHHHAVPDADAFGVVRQNVTDLLFRMYEQANSEGEKREVIQSLDQATRFPGIATYGDALTNMILDDTRRIVGSSPSARTRSSSRLFSRWSVISCGCIAVRKTKLAFNWKSAPKWLGKRARC